MSGMTSKQSRAFYQPHFHSTSPLEDEVQEQPLLKFLASEQRFSTLIEKSADAIVLLDSHGRIGYTSPSIRHLLGYEPCELVGYDAFTFLHSADLAPTADLFTTFIEEPGKSMTVELRVRHKDGSWHWMQGTVTNLLEEPDIGAIVANFRDISEQKHLQEKVQYAKEELEIILHNIADGIFVQDANGKLVYANQAAATLMDYPSVEELYQAPLLAYLERFDITDEHGNPLPITSLPGRRAIQGEANPHVTIRYIHKRTQVVRWALIKSTTIFDNEHQRSLVISIIQDITRFKELEQRKDIFISIASHELRTPVTSLQGYIEIFHRILEQEGRNELVRRLVQMEKQVNSLNGLITDLLDLSKIQAGKLELAIAAFDIGNLINDVVEALQHTTTTHTICVKGIQKKEIVGDKDRLGQVFINLLTNAVKYSPQADRVDVEIASEQDHIVVRVRDYGIGILPQEQEKIFERFYCVATAKDIFSTGLGMGLYISREIVKRHEGEIAVESGEGKGSTFTVSLPLKK
jgi:PAS domain S-box-containing protein